jgi:isocitrate lyase
MPGMDACDYPWDTVPKVVSKISKSQQWHDQRQRQFRLRHSQKDRANLENWDYLAPIVADGDMVCTSHLPVLPLYLESVFSDADTTTRALGHLLPL